MVAKFLVALHSCTTARRAEYRGNTRTIFEKKDERMLPPSLKLWRIQFDYANRRFAISLKGPTGFDSETNGYVSMPSAGIQLVNLIFHTFKWRI